MIAIARNIHVIASAAEVVRADPVTVSSFVVVAPLDVVVHRYMSYRMGRTDLCPCNNRLPHNIHVEFCLPFTVTLFVRINGLLGCVLRSRTAQPYPKLYGFDFWYILHP